MFQKFVFLVGLSFASVVMAEDCSFRPEVNIVADSEWQEEHMEFIESVKAQLEAVVCLIEEESKNPNSAIRTQHLIEALAGARIASYEVRDELAAKRDDVAKTYSMFAVKDGKPFLESARVVVYAPRALRAYRNGEQAGVSFSDRKAFLRTYSGDYGSGESYLFSLLAHEIGHVVPELNITKERGRWSSRSNWDMEKRADQFAESLRVSFGIED